MRFFGVCPVITPVAIDSTHNLYDQWVVIGMWRIHNRWRRRVIVVWARIVLRRWGGVVVVRWGFHWRWWRIVMVW